jgi:hypothetical protein
VEEDILELDVSVRVASFVDVLDSTQQLGEDEMAMRQIEWLL